MRSPLTIIPEQVTFLESLENGKTGEDILDNYFAEWFEIKTVPPIMQMVGIDRVFIVKDDKPWRLKTGVSWHSIEYKTDLVVARTGNYFIEIRITDVATREQRSGWALSSCAQRIIILSPQTQSVVVLDANALKAKVAEWQKLFQTKDSVITQRANGSHYASGIIVPKKCVEQFALKILIIGGNNGNTPDSGTVPGSEMSVVPENRVYRDGFVQPTGLRAAEVSMGSRVLQQGLQDSTTNQRDITQGNS